MVNCTVGLEDSKHEAEEESEKNVGGCDDNLAANRLKQLWVARAGVLGKGVNWTVGQKHMRRQADTSSFAEKILSSFQTNR
jgi:hypothetical protein